MRVNPKRKDSLIIDCTPQTGDCPLDCSDCFYNEDSSISKDEPLLPTIEESIGKIISVNSVNDSNIDSRNVMMKTKRYGNKFYNTSLPRVIFNKPTVLIINLKDPTNTYIRPEDIFGNVTTIMALRFRANLWNVELLEDAINQYRHAGITAPFIVSPMRYKDDSSIPEEYKQFYIKKKHIENEYYQLTGTGVYLLRRILRYDNVFWCGNPFNASPLCKDCQLCIHFYCSTMARINQNL